MTTVANATEVNQNRAARFAREMMKSARAQVDGRALQVCALRLSSNKPFAIRIINC
jgi:hypothetical protein